MGSCFCAKQSSYSINESHMKKVISDSYLPPDNAEKNDSKSHDTEENPSKPPKPPISIVIDDIKSNKNHVVLNSKNTNTAHLNHYSPYPNSNKSKPMHSFDVLHVVSNSAPIELLATPIDKNKLKQNAFHDEHKVNLYSKQTDYACGAFAHIYTSTVNDKKIAIKKIDVVHPNNMTDKYAKWSGKTSLKDANLEVNVLKHLNTDKHGNIIHLIDNFYETTAYNDLYLYLIMDFVESSLDKEIQKYAKTGESIPFNLIKMYSFQILNGLNYINYIKNIIHRDLKPENILINPLTNNIEICDFGCSIMINNDDIKENDMEMESYVCSRYYRAPELILKSKCYSYSVDMWSFGCILCEMFLGQILFYGDDNNDQLKEIIKIIGTPTRNNLHEMNNKYEYNKLLNDFGCNQNQINDQLSDWKFVFIGIDDFPNDVIDLIDKILIYSPKNRILPSDCVKHKYFNDISSTIPN